MLHKLCIATFLIMVVISYDVPIAETEKVDSVQESLQRDVQSLKEQVSTLSVENERLRTVVDRLNVQIQDLYFMTEPLRIRVADKQGGNFYYARTYAHTSDNWWGMLPSQVPSAELHSLLNSASSSGYSKNKIKGLSDNLLKMLKNPYFTTYEPESTFHESELTYHPDLKGYIEH